MKSLQDKFSNNPKQLFLLDAIGALVSAMMLGVVLVHFQEFFGIDSNTLYFLASFPMLFAVIDIYGYLLTIKRIGRFLQLIALLNLGYCLISLGAVILLHEGISVLGWTYILLEIIILLFLGMLEWQVGKGVLLIEK